MTGEGPLLLYDGICALCNGAVTFVLKRDRSGAVRFAPLQGETAAKLLAGRPELSGIDSMIWIDSTGAAFTRSAAALAIARHVGGGWATLPRTSGQSLLALPFQGAISPTCPRNPYSVRSALRR